MIPRRVARLAVASNASTAARLTTTPRTSATSQILASHQHRSLSHITSTRTTPAASWVRRRGATVQQSRAASRKPIRDEEEPPSVQRAQDAAEDAREAESPWTGQPRHPAPGQQTDPPPSQQSSAPEFRSKLRSENEGAYIGLENEINRIEEEARRIRSEALGPTAQADQQSSYTGPLPDLRQGIPSSFEPPTSDSSPSFKTQESESPDLNLTADPTRERARSDEEAHKEEYISSIDKRRQAFARWMYIAAAGFTVGAFAWLGREWQDDAETKAHPDAPNGMGPMAWYKRFRERLGGQFSHYTEPAFTKLLPDPPSDPAARMPYTLVLSLEDLLVHSEWTRKDGYKVAKRPGVDYFLRYLCQYYELVIFTTVMQANGDLVIRQLDPYSLCLPLFREGTHYINGEHVKDLSYLNRPLSKTLIIDTNPSHTSLQPENAIILPKWSGHRSDTHTPDLIALIPFLEYIAGMELPDVRKVLASYRGTHIPTEFHRRETNARKEFTRKREEHAASRRPGAGALASLSGSLGFKSSQGLMQVPGEQTPAEAYAQGKMLSDQIRERGQRGYAELERQIRENGEMWLRQRAEEEKKAMEEGVRNMTGGLSGFFGGGGGGEKK